MKRIKITEKQAELLGLKKIYEAEDDGMKSVNTALGEAIIRIVIGGASVPKFKDRLMHLIARQDNTAKVGFYDQTGKIVGNVKEIKFDSIKRDIKALDPTIIVEKKPIAKALKEGVKNVVKISKEQYNRIFASGLINEADVVKGGLNRVDKSFKKELKGQNLNKTVKVSEGEEKEMEDPFKDECIELIKYLYRKSEKLSPFWEQNGLTYDAICDTLLAKNVIIKNGGRYELAKSLGDPQSAIQAVVDTLRTHVKPQVEEPALETEATGGYPAGAEQSPEAPYNQPEVQTTQPKPVSNPQLKPIAMNREIVLFQGPDGGLYVFYYYDMDKKEFADYAVLDKKYVGKDDEGQPDFEYGDDFEVDANVVSGYVNHNLDNISKGEGMHDFEQGAQLVKLDDALRNDLLAVYDKDKGVAKALAPIQEETPVHQVAKEKLTAAVPVTPTTEKPTQHAIVAKLAELKAKEQARRKEAGEIDETQFFIPNDDSEKGIAQWIQKELATSPQLTGRQLGQMYNADFGTGYNLQDFDMIIDKYKLRPALGEMTSAASSGAFVAPMGAEVVHRKVAETPVVAEATTTQTAGDYQYDTPGLPVIGGNGEFKKAKKTKAQKSTQYPNGTFVEFDECVKMNNNKKAQEGGCSQGAVDNVVKQKKSSTSVISPSLDEHVEGLCGTSMVIAENYGITYSEAKKLVDIAMITKKSVDEVKAIIDLKKLKP